jgi:hypothetical protein
MEEKFPWLPFYSELAPALLSCKNDRKPLVDWIYSDISQVGEKSLVDYIHMRDGSKVKDIDPFSRSPGRFPDPLIYNGRLLILKKPAIAF